MIEEVCEAFSEGLIMAQLPAAIAQINGVIVN